MGILHIIAFHKGAETGRCNYAFLNPVSYTSLRQLTFKDFKIINPCIVGNSGHSYINVSVYLKNSYDVDVELSKFKIVPHEEAVFSTDGNIEVHGTIVPDWYTNVYDQVLIDAFYEWETGLPTENSYPSYSIKSARLQAKGIYSGLPKSLTKGNVIIDGKFINDHYDFYDALSKSLTGPKGFMGSCYNSLHDCLIESYDKDSSTNIIFKDTDNIIRALGNKEFSDTVELLKQYSLKVTF